MSEIAAITILGVVVLYCVVDFVHPMSRDIRPLYKA